MLHIHTDEHYMKLALQEAEVAAQNDEIPVGALIVIENRIIGRSGNQVERLIDVTAHAEMLALTAAQNYLGSKYLDKCTMYVTLEPCVMCAGALFWAQLGKLVVAAKDPDRGFSRMSPKVLHPKTELSFGLKRSEAEKLIGDFFQKMRNKN